ncbi:TetR/AcrR family transcriptional regulator [Streptococcus tangpeifui]|uniref:TetR/AcrR family transcriptional regulator n=1 Tax=Streptococcus tangpeifui TaxID=2709400 RepID=UPI0037D9F45B
MVSEKINQTKESILAAAQSLFQEKDYQNVGIREIAKRAGCSHTAIYLYFKNKSEILYEVAHKPLEKLYHTLLALEEQDLTPSVKLLKGSHIFIQFGFDHYNSFSPLFLDDGERVDQEQFTYPISELRMKSFQLLKETVMSLLSPDLTQEQAINIVRGVYLFLQGMVTNYADGQTRYDERLRTIVTDYLTYTIIQKRKE